MKLKIVAFSLFCVVCCAFIAVAEDASVSPADSPTTQPISDSPKAAAASVPPATTQPRDPTQIDPALARALAAGQGGALVQVTRRGLIAISGKPTMALIELQGSGISCVQEGSTLTASVNGVRTTLKVESLSREGMVITADSKNVTVLIH